MTADAGWERRGVVLAERRVPPALNVVVAALPQLEGAVALVGGSGARAASRKREEENRFVLFSM